MPTEEGMMYLDAMRNPAVKSSPAAGNLQPVLFDVPAVTLEKNGVVYTKKWVVDLILDLSGYCPEQDLTKKKALEPAAGEGAFLLPMVSRLLQSCRLHGHTFGDMEQSLLAYEIDAQSAELVRLAVLALLGKEGMLAEQAEQLTASWIRKGDYLLDESPQPKLDFAIGNPPYIRLEDIKPDVASLYRARYSTMVGRADLYIAFFEAALKQLTPAGVCAFICADRWMLNQYGAELRRLVTSSFGVEAVIEMHKADAFDVEVSAYPAISIIRRGKQAAAIVASVNPDAVAINGTDLARTLSAVRNSLGQTALPSNVRAARVETWFKDADPWPCVSPERLALLTRLEIEFPPLESKATKTTVGIGVATGCDDVFITKNSKLVEASRLRPLAMAHDAKQGKLAWSGHYLVDPWNEEGLVDLADFPRLSHYFEAHAERLKKRNVGQRMPERWYRTIDRVNQGLLAKDKLYFPDIKSRIYPVLDEGKTYPHHNLYYVQSETWDMEVLGGLLLSRVAQFFVECYGVRMRGGYLRFQAQYLRRIRVPHPAMISREQADTLKDAFREHDAEKATSVAFQLYHIDPNMGELIGH